MNIITVILTVILSLTSLTYGQYGAPPSPTQQPSYSSYQSGQYNQPSGYGQQSSFSQPTNYGGYSNQVAPASNSAPGVGPSAGTCSFNAACFSQTPNTAIANAYPFRRETPMSCEECLHLCMKLQTNPDGSPYTCQAAVYDYNWKACDIFAVAGNGPNTYLVGYSGRDYFGPLGPSPTCQAGGPTQSSTSAPTSSDCPSGQTAKLLKYPDSSVSNMNGPQFPANSDHDCASACKANQAPNNGPAAPCKAFAFSSGQCTLSPTDPSQSGGAITATPGSVYGEKICLDSSLVSSCPGDLSRVPQHILVGFAQQVVDANSFQDCLNQCLSAKQKQGFTCSSGMFYSSDTSQNCILNSETKDTQSSLFVPENRDQVDYFQTGCGGGGSRLRLVFQEHEGTSSDDASDGDWTRWNTCYQSRNGTVHRYRRCELKDIRKCPQETRVCPDGMRKKGPMEVSKSIVLKLARDDPEEETNIACKEVLPEKQPRYDYDKFCRAYISPVTGCKHCDRGLKRINSRLTYCNSNAIIDC